MTTTDWQQVNEDLRNDRRGDIPVPTHEEMRAFYAGEMTESEEERMREAVAAYPALADMYTGGRAKTKPTRHWPVIGAGATLLAVIMACTAVVTVAYARRVDRTPSTAAEVFVLSDPIGHWRGTMRRAGEVYHEEPRAIVEVMPTTEHVTLLLAIWYEQHGINFDVTLSRTEGRLERVVWSSDGPTKRANLYGIGDSVPLYFPVSHLKPGDYTITLYARTAEGKRGDVADRYLIRVPER